MVMPQKKLASKGNQKISGNPIAWMVAPAVALFAFLIVLSVDFYFFYRVGPNPKRQTIVIPDGASLRDITALLEKTGIINVGFSFYWTARLSGAGRDLKAGEYRIVKGASQAEILRLFLAGKTVLHRIVIPEGLPSAKVVTLLMNDERLSGEIKEVPDEGTLLPETYYYSLGDSRQDILKRMQEAQKALLDQLWSKYDYSLPFDTPEEAVIIASIVEEETAIAEERPLIAAVYLNRLKANMRLQSDPTVIYGINGGYPLGRGLRVSELKRETPYNTYKFYGLPPGPISNPGTASLEAVFHPADSNVLYFVADGKGGHVFAETLEEHNRNVAQWRRIENGTN